MVVEFNLSEIKNTPICKSSDSDFPLTQSAAIKKALKWAEKEFDPTKNWVVDKISLKFISIQSSHCVYLIELKPVNEMQTLTVGVLMDGTLKIPKPKHRY